MIQARGSFQEDPFKMIQARGSFQDDPGKMIQARGSFQDDPGKIDSGKMIQARMTLARMTLARMTLPGRARTLHITRTHANSMKWAIQSIHFDQITGKKKIDYTLVFGGNTLIYLHREQVFLLPRRGRTDRGRYLGSVYLYSVGVNMYF
jgi:hypothetical protein